MQPISTFTSRSITFISDSTISARGKKLTSSIALAKILAYDSNLPVEPVKDIVSYYQSTVKMDVVKSIFNINEYIATDIDKVESLHSMFYIARYYQLHQCKLPVLITKETAVEDFFGISLSVPSDIIQTIKDNPLTISKAVLDYSQLLKDIKGV